MEHFSKSLRFKVTLLVIAVELLIFSGVGIFYTHRFSQEIDNAIIARLSIPGLLMTRGELSFDAVSDKRTMEGLLREPYSEGIVIGLDGQVYFSSDPARRDTHLDSIDGLRLPTLESPSIFVDKSDLITPFQDHTGTYLTYLSPLRPNGKLTGYLYLKVGTEISEAEKRKISILFAIGSLGTMALTAAILSWLLHLMVIKRINNLVDIFRRFAQGNYATRAQSSGDDEIATLMNGFNGLAERLEDSMAHLSESETRFRVLVEHAPEAILVYDVDTQHFVDANQNAERLFACSREQLRQKISATLYAPVQKGKMPAEPGVDEYLQRTLAGEEVAVERVITNANGQQLLCEVRLVLLPSRSSRLIRASYLDITERKRAEEALQKSETLLRATQRLTKVGGWEIDVKSGRSFWTEELYRIHEIPDDPDIDHLKESMKCYQPEDRKILSEAFQLACEQGKSYDLELPFTTYTGKPLWIRTTAQAIYEEGKVVRLIGNLLDITERKRTEMALRENERFLDAIVEHVPNMLFVKDAKDLKFIRFNLAGERLLGYSREELLGKSDHDFFPKEQADFFTANDRAIIAGGKLLDIQDEPINTRLLGLRYLHTKKIPIYADDGSPLYLLGISEDITEQKKAEQEIRTLNRELERRVTERTAELQAVNKELEAFSYSVSHDLRAPLRHIDGFLDLLKERTEATLDDRSQHYMNTISDAAKRMGTLIDDLLAFSRMGRKEMATECVDLTALLKDVIHEFDSEIQGRDIEWRVANLPVVTGDRAMLRVVLVNLISNALKFTQKRAKSEIEISSLPESATEAVVFVRDNGAGFDMQYADKLFGVFQRLHGSDEFEGTGIGLANVRRIINRHGGRTWAQGLVDGGATFYFSLPKAVQVRQKTGD